MKLTVVRTETQVQQRKKEKQIMAIILRDIHDAVVDYFSNQVVASITVEPLKGNEINPGENFNIKLTAKNSADNKDQGVQISNVCYYVEVDHVGRATLTVPDASTAVAYSDLNQSSKPLTPGKTGLQFMFLFPPDNILEPGDTDTLPIEGEAVKGGTPTLTFRLYGNVDLGYLFPVKQTSVDFKLDVSIVS